MFECDIARPRSVAVLCMLNNIRCNPMQPLYGAEPVSHVPVQLTCGALVAHRYTYAPLRCRTSPYRGTFIRLSVSLWNSLADPVFDCVTLAGFVSRTEIFFISQSYLILFCLLQFSLSLLSVYRKRAISLASVAWGIRIQPTFALVRVVRGN